jgi:hypothetical protein
MVKLQRSKTTRKGRKNREGLKDFATVNLTSPTVAHDYLVFHCVLFFNLLFTSLLKLLRENTKINSNFYFAGTWITLVS